MKMGFFSIQSKILAIVLIFFTAIQTAFFVYSMVTTKNFKEFRIAEVSKTVAYEIEHVGKTIAEMERNAVDLALAGGEYHRSGRYSAKLGAAVSIENFDSFRAAVGGGIWFEPYALEPARKRACYYAFYDSSVGKVRYDPEFETEEYDYHTQIWYTQIKARIKSKYHAVWTVPYIDDAGTNALMTTVGAGIYNQDGKFIGMSTVDWEIQTMVDTLSAIKPTASSFVLLGSPQDDYVISDTSDVNSNHAGSSLKGLPWYDSLEFLDDGSVSQGNIVDGGKKYITFSRRFDNGWSFSVQIPSSELFLDIEKRNNRFTLIMAISSLVLLAITSYLLSRLISRPLKRLTTGVVELGGGNLDKQIEIHSRDEIGTLATAFNKMTVDLKASIERGTLESAKKVEAEAANRAKSAFLSTVSHEIRTPLNAILGITEIQMENEELGGEVREALGKIYTSGDLLLGIINDILDLSKIEAGKLELVVAKYETASLISDTAQLNIMRIGSKPIIFDVQVDEKLPLFLSGDELRVKQILNNLLSNAFKYTKEGTVKLAIFPEVALKDGEVILAVSVSDTGQGMSREQIDKLFDEYSRFNLEANRTTEGTGLGMSITRNLIQMMDGDISVESEPGVGSTFTVRLPQVVVGSEVLGSAAAENLHRFRTDGNAQMKGIQITREPMPYGSVLIVDDVETNIYVAKGLMSPYGLKIDSAPSGFIALDKVKSGKEYDIIFMDHMMPQMDGIETVQKIRSFGYKHPIVALTANAVAGQAEIFLDKGFDGFISKPIDMRQLNSILNKLIRDKQTPEVIKEAKAQAEAKKEHTSGSHPSQAIDPEFAKIFVRDASKSLAVIESIVAKEGKYSEDDVRTYIINVHGMKSALANIGQKALSDIASKLEQLGRSGDVNAIESDTPSFLVKLHEVIDGLVPKEDVCDDGVEDDTELLQTKLQLIKVACGEYDESGIESALSELKGKAWSHSTRELLGVIAEHLLHSDFDEIIEVTCKYMENK
ncbi:MAG: ATP-binding protein [Holophagaceae bacterium]|nr:ATP-binding protein [Holophagaceae bacterium]